MCFSIFNKVKIPYPEEKPDFSRTVENTNMAETIQDFLTKYQVRPDMWDFWNGVRELPTDTKETLAKLEAPLYVQVGGVLREVPAYAISQIAELHFEPPYLNEGTIAHEYAHIDFLTLTPDEVTAFEAEYNRLLLVDPLMKALYNYKIKNADKTWLTINEIHSEVFRYLGPQMPESLKKYYPLLF